MYKQIGKYLLIAWMISCTCTLFACGGGSSNGATSLTSTQVVSVTGKVAANIIYPGTVRIYAVNSDGTLKLPLLAEGQTKSDGSYLVSIGDYKGAIVGIAFGRYTDEATNTKIDITENNGIYGALPALGEIGNSQVSLNITPFTEVAYRKALSTTDFAGNIAASNLAVSQLFGVDITKTPPLSFDIASLSSSTTTSDQVKLEILLATLSQFTATNSANPLAPSESDLRNTIAKLVSGITVTGSSARISPEIAYQLQQAGQALGTNINTKSVVASGGTPAQTVLNTLASFGSTGGTKSVKFRIRTTGNYVGKIYGIVATVTTPAGFELSSTLSGVTLPGVVVASGQAEMNSYTDARLSGSTLKLAVENATGFGVGEFVTVYGEISIDTAIPMSEAFTPVTVVKVVDGNGVTIQGVGVEVF